MEINSSNPFLTTSSTQLKKGHHRISSPDPLNVQLVAEPVLRKRSNTSEDPVIQITESISSSPRITPAPKPATRAQVVAASATIFVQKNVKKENIKKDSQKKISIQKAALASSTIATPKTKSFFNLGRKHKEKEVESIIENAKSSQSVIAKKDDDLILNLQQWEIFPVSAAIFNELCTSDSELLKSYIKVVKAVEILQNKILQNESEDKKGLEFLKTRCGLYRKWLDEKFEKKANVWIEAAKQHLAAGTLPKPEIKSRVDYEETMSAMARLLLLKNPPKRISGGSGGVYLIFDGDKPVFVFKPSDEIMGASRCPNTNEKLVIEEDRIIDDARLAFPLSEDSLREYAFGILFSKAPRRVLACVKLLGNQDEKSLGTSVDFNTRDYRTGILIEYVDHLFTIDDLQNHVQLSYQKKESPVDEFKELSLEQQKVVDECVSSIKTPQNGPITKSQLSVWNRSTLLSLDQMLLELLSVPNFDPNGKNLLLKNSNTLNEYEQVGIDAGQVFPDTWQSINMPSWINAERFDIPLNQSKYLNERIQLLNAIQILGILKNEGIVFQEKAQVVNHPVSGKIEVGGDLYNILNAFHTVAKVGCLSGKSVNEVFHVLYEQGKLHHLFKRAEELYIVSTGELKKEKQKLLNSTSFQDFIMSKEYKSFFKPDCYKEETKQFWKLFEAVIFDQFNKPKPKAQ